jgi:hypothetical protein
MPADEQEEVVALDSQREGEDQVDPESDTKPRRTTCTDATKAQTREVRAVRQPAASTPSADTT